MGGGANFGPANLAEEEEGGEGAAVDGVLGFLEAVGFGFGVLGDLVLLLLVHIFLVCFLFDLIFLICLLLVHLHLTLR